MYCLEKKRNVKNSKSSDMEYIFKQAFFNVAMNYLNITYLWEKYKRLLSDKSSQYNAALFS